MDLVHFICELEKKNPWVKWIFFFLERIKGTHEFEYCNKSLSSLNFGTNNVLWWRLHTQSSLWCFISVTQLDSTFLNLITHTISQSRFDYKTASTCYIWSQVCHQYSWCESFSAPLWERVTCTLTLSNKYNRCRHIRFPRQNITTHPLTSSWS